MTFVLDATNKALKFTVTAGAGADVHFTSHWADATTSELTEGQTQGASNGSTAVDVVAAPAASTRRVVKLITFHNTNSTTSRTVTLVNDVGGTSRTIAVFTLAPLATWYSDTAATTAVIDRDYGDITVSGSGATWTIDNSAVTLAKIQNIATSRLLGRSTSGSGVVEELTAGTGIITWLGTPSSANLFSALTTKTGTGGDVMFSTAPTMTNPKISSGNLELTGTGQRFTAAFAGAFTDRFAFMNSTANSSSLFTVLPNGTNDTAGILFSGSGTDFVNFSQGQCVIIGASGIAEFRVGSRAPNSGTVLPFMMHTADISRIRIEPNGNIGINGASYGASSVGVIHIANATTVPTGNPTGGGVLYVTGGALKYRGSSGTVTDIAAA